MYTGKTSKINNFGVILDEGINTNVVKVIRKSDRVIANNLVLEASILSVISV